MKITLAAVTLSSLFATGCALEDEDLSIDEGANAEEGFQFDQAARCNFGWVVKKYFWSDPVQWDFVGYGRTGSIRRYHDPNDQKLEWRELAAPKETIANSRANRMIVEPKCERVRSSATQELSAEGEAKYGFTKSLTNEEEISAGLVIPVPPVDFEIGYSNKNSTTWGQSVEFTQKWGYKASRTVEIPACQKGQLVLELRAVNVDMGLYGKLKAKRSVECIFAEPGNHSNTTTVPSDWHSSNNQEALFGTTRSPLKEFKITTGETKTPLTTCPDCTACQAPSSFAPTDEVVCPAEVEADSWVEGDLPPLDEIGEVVDPVVEPEPVPVKQDLLYTPIEL